MMHRFQACCFLIVATALSPASWGDDLLHRFEGDVPPYDPSVGWLVGNPCENGCSESIENGHFVLRWTRTFVPAGYSFPYAAPPNTPPTLWVEWQFRSNHPIGQFSYTCDAKFLFEYRRVFDLAFMYGDAGVSASGDDAVLGLDLDNFHTYRLESLDGVNYRVSVDGRVFVTDADSKSVDRYRITFSGLGGCLGDEWPNSVNEWDFVRLGTIAYGEEIVSTHPPTGFVDAGKHPALDRLTVTYEEPNYVYVDEIAVETTPLSSPLGKGGGGPVVVATRRLDNAPPETVEIVLDRPIPYNATTRFTFNDGVIQQSVEFTYAPGDTDGDGDADLADFSWFQNCFGALLTEQCHTCWVLDVDGDSVIDLADYLAFYGALGF